MNDSPTSVGAFFQSAKSKCGVAVRQVLLPGSRGLHPPTKTDVFAGPRPRDDKFLSFLFCSLFKKKERCVILGLDPRIQVNKVARMRACIFFKVQSANVVSRCDGINYLGPVVCIHPRKLTFSRGPGHGMTRKERRAQATG